ncbi:MAG: uroporphyrinogen-III C-methyltransferase [Hyphomicrobiaceae bacterium]
MKMPGRVWLVGAGPGDPELLTLKAARLIGSAEVIVHDRLVSRQVLALANAEARLVPVGKQPGWHPVPQSEINSILVREASAGRLVVRLKGGDPFIFGRGSEEMIAVRAAGIRCDVVPGISAAQGAASSLALPLTHRGLASSVRFITGHARRDQALVLDWAGLADPETTLVVYMGAATISSIADRLIANGLPGEMPVLAISDATLPREQRLISRLSSVGQDVVSACFEGPVLFVIGRVVALVAEGGAYPLLEAVRDAAPAWLPELADA